MYPNIAKAVGSLRETTRLVVREEHRGRLLRFKQEPTHPELLAVGNVSRAVFLVHSLLIHFPVVDFSCLSGQEEGRGLAALMVASE